MAWCVGKCDRCGEPKGPWAACMFKVRVLERFTSWKFWRRTRVWRWWCDECSQLIYDRRRKRLTAKEPSHD